MQAWRSRRERASSEAQAWTPGMAAALVGLIRGNPHMEHPIVVALAGAGFDSADPIAEFAAYEAAAQTNERLGGDWPDGQPIPRNRLSQGTPEDRFRAEVQAGYTMGLFDEEGLLREPYTTDEEGRRERNARRDPMYRQFERIMDSAARAGVDVPYVTYEERPAIVRHGDPQTSTPAQLREEGENLRQGRIEHLDTEPTASGGGAAGGVAQAAGSQAAGALGLGEVQAAGMPTPSRAGVEAGLETLRGLSRGAFMALDAPVQELQGQFRNLIGAMHGRGVDWAESQSDLGVTLGRTFTGRRALPSGEGFFVDQRSPLAQERHRRELERGTIGGHAITFGRQLAYTVGADPDSTAFNLLSGTLDAGVQLFGDPSNWLLGAAGEVGMGRRFLIEGAEEAAIGGVRGRVRSVMRTTAEQFLNGRQGRRIVDHLAGEGNAGRVWNTLGRKVDPNLAARIADTTDPDDVADLLRGELGLTFRRTSDLPRLGERAYQPGVYVERRQTPGLRALVNRMPGHRIDLDDPQASMREMEAMLRNARAEPHVVESFLDRMARQESNLGRYKVTQDAVRDVVRGSLKEHGVADPDVLDDVTRMFNDSHEAVRHYLIDTITDGGWGDIAIGGKSTGIPSPHLLVEHTRYAPLPDARRIRRLTANPLVKRVAGKGTILGRTAASEVGELRFPVALLESFQNEIWKPVTLLRAAWTLRVVGDEQLRMAGDAKEAIFRHPISFAAWVIGRDGRRGGRGALDVQLNPLKEADEHIAAMSKARGSWLGEPGEVPMVDFITYRLGGHRDADYRRAWASELATLFSDPVSREVARRTTMDEAVEWFTNGPGQKFRRQLQEAHPELADPNVARNYIESITELQNTVTGGNGDLLEVIRTGRLRGKAILEPDGIRHRDLSRQLQGYTDFAPEEVVGRRFARNESHGGRVKAAWDRGTDMLFGFLMTKPTNHLSRSPMFRQSYWQRVEELIPHMDEATKLSVLDAARKSNLDPKIPVRIGSRKTRRMERTKAGGDMTLDEVDQLAKGHALDETKRLLYDLTERSQFADAMRIVFPFGSAWQEMFGRWAQILRENPKGVRRFQQAVQGARGEGFGEVMGAPEGQGWFHKDGNGEEVFSYPWTAPLTRSLTGVPIPMTGRVQGLNMMGSIAPGLGPVAQVPVAALLPDKPGWQRTARELLMPFGAPSDEGGMEAWTQQLNLAPAWMKRGWQALNGGGYSEETDRIYIGTVMDVARYLESTGKYDLSTPEGMQELLEDAKSKARRFYGIRALAQFVVPSAPAPEWMVETDQGMRQTAALAEEFRRMQDENPDTAIEDFLELFGDNVTLVMQAKSRTVVAGLEATQEVEDWIDGHQELIEEYPNTWAFFAPRGDEDDFDYAAYRSQIKRGERQPLTLEQWVRSRNNMLGNMIYHKARRMAGPHPNEERMAWLRDVKTRIREGYPGYGDRTGLAERTDPELLMTEFEQVAEDPRIRDTEAGRGLRIYMQGRQMASDEAIRRGLTTPTSWARAQSTRDLRDWLRNEVAPRIVQNYPAFDSVWTWLEGEMIDDTEVANAAA